MTISYTVQATILVDSQWTTRANAAAVAAAIQILGEATTGSPARDKKRQEYATRILNEDGAAMAGMRRAALASIGAGASTASDASPAQISDAEIDTAVAAVWDDCAGVTTLEST